jgi:Flp pilus assembly protein TadG
MMKATAPFHDERGAATIELAILAPILASLIVGMSDISDAYSKKVQLEQVAHRLVEKAQQNGFQTTDETAYETEAVAAAAATGMTASSADVTYWLECTTGTTTTTTTYTGSCATGATRALYMQIDIQGTYTPIILKQFAGANTNSTFTVHGVAGIRIQ